MRRLSTMAVSLALASSAAAQATAGPLPFLSDDYAKARAEARTRDVPLFVEVWAPW